MIVALAAGCGTAPASPSPAHPSPAAIAPASPSATALASVSPRPTAASAPPTFAPTPSRSKPAPRTGRTSSGWEITVYYTAVERFHHGTPTKVIGCPRLACASGNADLGTYPADFVDAVREEGSGRTASGRYLNWSYDIGFWLDSAPRNAGGGVLTPFAAAAADPGVLPRGTDFTVAACGRQDDGSSPAAAVCAALRRNTWRVIDEFTPGLGGPRHIDAYIGPETGPDFTDSKWYVTLTGARLVIR